MTREEIQERVAALREELDAMTIPGFAARYLDVMHEMPPHDKTRADLTNYLIFTMIGDLISAEEED